MRYILALAGTEGTDAVSNKTRAMYYRARQPSLKEEYILSL